MKLVKHPNLIMIFQVLSLRSDIWLQSSQAIDKAKLLGTNEHTHFKLFRNLVSLFKSQTALILSLHITLLKMK